MSNDFLIKIVDKPSDILNILHYGTKIPVMDDFHEFILYDFNVFHPKSFILIKENIILGHCLVFHIDSSTLYFGFFNIQDHDPFKIEILMNHIINFAKQHNYKNIEGPINIPTIIFGWGFMEKNSIDTVFRSKPINPPIYIDVFKTHGFLVKTQEISWEGDLPKINEAVSQYDFQNYELINVSTWEEFKSYTKVIMDLNSKNIPSESLMTPNVEKVAINYMNFFIQFGDPYMVTLVKNRANDKIIGYLSSLPNPFRKDSFSIYTMAIDEEYRNKGLGWYLTNNMLNKARAHGITYMSTPIERSNKSTQAMCEKAGLKILRKHSIMQYRLY